jgi:hypothetical protein
MRKEKHGSISLKNINLKIINKILVKRNQENEKV